MNKKTAIILGATGLTGRYLLEQLLDSDEYQKIKIFTRRASGKQHPKLQEFVGDLLQLRQYADDFTADEVFCCIGTTKAKTPDEKLYHAIDFGIPATAAKLCEQNNIPTFSVISAIGADAKSSIFYNKTKGEMEQAVLACNIPNILIYRPSFIYGKREDRRLAESMGVFFFKALEWLMIGKLRKYRSISGKALAEALFLGVKRTGHQIIFRDKFASK